MGGIVIYVIAVILLFIWAAKSAPPCPDEEKEKDTNDNDEPTFI